tara:strand:+ start:2095 stop:2382 length:288 start_codon:yes stop_codon:yes gene_type:complete
MNNKAHNIIGWGAGLAVGITIGVSLNNVVLGIGLGVAIGAGLSFTIQKNATSNTKNQLSDEAVEAMANKIIFEAEQHRKNRDSYNYMKMVKEEEE